MQYQQDTSTQPLLFRTLQGQLVAVRQALPADTLRIVELLNRLSARSFYLRYLRPGRFSVGEAWKEATRMTQGQPPDHTTLIATIQLGGYDDVVAVGELVRGRHNPAVGELAFMVRDDMQRLRIGSFLLWRLIRVAQRDGFAQMSASMLAENHSMRRMLGSLGLPTATVTRSGETQILMTLPAPTARSHWHRTYTGVTLPRPAELA